MKTTTKIKTCRSRPLTRPTGGRSNVNVNMRLKSQQCKLKNKFKNGYLTEVKNPCGRKPELEIYQGLKAGFSVRERKSGKELNISSRNAEALAKKLSKQGHKKVVIND